MYVSCAFSLALFLLFVCSYFVIIFLDASLYFNEKERTDVDFGEWERINRIYCMEKIYFNFKKNF